MTTGRLAELGAEVVGRRGLLLSPEARHLVAVLEELARWAMAGRGGGRGGIGASRRAKMETHFFRGWERTVPLIDTALRLAAAELPLTGSVELDMRKRE